MAPVGLDFSQFAERGYLKGSDQFKKYETAGFKTLSDKVELSLSQATKLMAPALPEFDGFQQPEDSEYPLVLTGAKSRYYLHSSYRWLGKLRKNNRIPRP